MAVTRAFGSAYPTIEEVFNNVRAVLNDTFRGATGTWGEGRIWTDEWPPALTYLNLGTQQLQRDLENLGYKTTTEEIFYASLPPVTGAAGAGIADPTVQVYLDWNGYWDGTTLHGQPPTPANPQGDPTLPLDFILPLRVQERATGGSRQFVDVEIATDGLPSVYQTAISVGQWEWRGDAIYMNGALIPMDLRVRYRSTILPKFPLALDPSLFPSTFIPFADSGDAIAYSTAYIFSSSRVSSGSVPPNAAADLLVGYQDRLGKIANRNTRAMQRKRYSRAAFGESGDVFGWGPG